MKSIKVLLLCVFPLLFSCVPNRKIVYLQDGNSTKIQQQNNMYFIDEPLDNTIKAGDELFIKVTSADEGPNAFNEESQVRIYDPTVISYTVDGDGSIKLPYVNKIKLSGLTLVQASDFIEEELSQYLLYPSVFIRFVNNRVTILGEVNSPGVYVFNYKNINVLQAIGYANDVAVFGNRNKVLIIRDEGEYRSKYEIDLTDDELLTSNRYMVKSNDIIYVEPLKSKKWGLATFPYDLLLSIASLSIVIMTFFITYIK